VTARAPVLLGIDLGTTQIKAGLVTADGTLLGMARVRYPLDVDPASGRAEQDPERWWNGLLSAIRELAVTTSAGLADVVGICVAGHGPTLAAIDAVGRAVRPAITWLDSRSATEADELTRATGLRGWSLGVLPAARWLERHEPEVGDRALWYLNTWETLTFRMTGIAATTLVSGQPFPRPEVLAEGGLAADKVAPTIAAGSVVGGLLPEVAETLGLPLGTPVVGGLVDAFASFHGARMVEPGDAIDVGGAAGGFGVYWDRQIEATGSFSTPAPLPGLWSVGGAMAATGAALDWFRDDILGGSRSTRALIEEAASVPAGADGLIFLPYLAGERSPLWDPTARGAFAGLTLRHGRAHLVRAILEAAALSIRHVAEPILDAGVRVSAMRACGGPASSETWNRIKADVTGFPVEVPRVLETAVVGAAIVAAVGVGVHPDLPTAIRSMTAIDRRLEPDPDIRPIYDATYRAYVELHPAIAPGIRELGEADRLAQAVTR
jgi:xylulokinase